MTEEEHIKLVPNVSSEEVRYFFFVNLAYMNEHNSHVKGINSIGPNKVKSKYSQCAALLCSI